VRCICIHDRCVCYVTSVFRWSLLYTWFSVFPVSGDFMLKLLLFQFLFIMLYGWFPVFPVPGDFKLKLLFSGFLSILLYGWFSVIPVSMDFKLKFPGFLSILLYSWFDVSGDFELFSGFICTLLYSWFMSDDLELKLVSYSGSIVFPRCWTGLCLSVSSYMGSLAWRLTGFSASW